MFSTNKFEFGFLEGFSDREGEREREGERNRELVSDIVLILYIQQLIICICMKRVL